MSVKKKGFVTLDTVGLFDDSDIEEEISSFLQDSESKQKPQQKPPVKEIKIDQKGSQVTKDEKKNTSDVKSTKGKINQVKNSDQKNVPVVNSTKGNQETKSNIIGISDPKLTKNKHLTQVNKKVSNVIGAKKNEEKKEIENENVLGNKYKNTSKNSESSSNIIVIDDLEFFITDEKDEEGKSIERDSCYSPISSVDSELFDSTLEQEIQSFLGKESLSSDTKQSGKGKNKSSVSAIVKTGDVSRINNEKGENDTVDVTEIKNAQPSKNNHVELAKEKTEKLNNDLPKSQKEKTASNSNQIEISVSNLESKDIVKEREFSDKNIKDDKRSENEIPKTQGSEEKVDFSLKTMGNDDKGTPKMQDSKRETQQQTLSNKEKIEFKSTTTEPHGFKKETQQSDFSSKGKTIVKSTTPEVQDSKKEMQQSDLSSKGKTVVKSAIPEVQDSKKEMQQSNLSSKGKTVVKSATPEVQDSKKEMQQSNLSSKGKTVVKSATPEVQDSKKEMQQSDLSSKGKTVVKSATPEVQDSKKEMQQSDLSSKGKTVVKSATPEVQDSKKEMQQLDSSSERKTEIKSATPEVQDSKKETQQSNLSSKRKTEVISAAAGIQDSKKEIQQLDSSDNWNTGSKPAPELGIIIGDYEKDESFKKYVDKELHSEGNKADVTSEETKQVNKRKTEDSSENERDIKKSKKEHFTSSDYEKQLELKITDIKDKLSRSSDFIINKYSKESQISRNILRRNGLICDLDDMRKCSPNEWTATVCSFTIGIGSVSNELTVGFKMEDSENKKTLNATVKSISEVVHNYPDHVIGTAKHTLEELKENIRREITIISEELMQTSKDVESVWKYKEAFSTSFVTKVFEKMIQAHARGKGGGPHLHDVKKIWKELCIYTNKKQELMLIMRVSADSTSIIKEIYNLYVDFFKNGEGKKFRVTSIYITCYYKMRGRNDCWIEHLTGSQNIEIFRGLYLNYVGINEPWSNIYGLRMLCRTVEELLMPTRSTTVLEIFCSTGLLGHYLSKMAGEVLAYDDPEVIRSTTKNAIRNNITGVQYFSGDPQSELLYRIEMARYSTITAVISCNPYFNRHISISLVMKILREVKKLERLVVVATANTLLHIPFRTICAPYDMERGEPFFPVKAIPIDTKPLQDGYTVAILFKRQFESGKHEYSAHVSRPKVKEEWWNWIKDDELKDRWEEDEEKKGRKTDEERKDDGRRKKRNDEEEKKGRLEEQATRMIRGELERRRQEEFGRMKKEEEGDRRGKRRFDDDDDREYVHGMWQRKKYKDRDEKNRKLRIDEEEEEKKRQLEEKRKQQLEEETKRQLEEEMKRKIQEQLDIRRLQELERIRKEEEEQMKREEEERKKKEMEEKAKRLTFFRKRLKEEQRRRAQEDQKVEIEKEQIEEEMVARNKEIEEDQKKQAQIKSKKKQLEKEEKKPLEQLRRQIEEEKIKIKRAAERKREERKRKIEEEERRQQLGNQRIPVWEQPPLKLGILEQRKVEDVQWSVLEEERYRRRLEEEAYRKVEKEIVVFDYNHSSNRPSVVAKQEKAKASAVESNIMAPPSNAVSRPVMKWLEKLREVSGDANVKEKSTVIDTSNKWQTSSAENKSENLSVSPWPLQENPVTKPPSLLSLHVEKPASLLPSSSDKTASGLLSAPIRPLLQPPGFFSVPGRDDLPGVGRSNVGTRQPSLPPEPSRPLIKPFVEQKGLSSIAFGDLDNFPNNRYNYGGNAGENSAAGLRGMVSHGAPSVSNLYGFAGGGSRYDNQTGNSGDVHPSDSFSFKQTLQEMRTYGSSYTGQGQF